MLNFIIPVRHHHSVPDWDSIKPLMAKTFASVAGQTSDAWRAIVVANQGADIPSLPRAFHLVEVDLPLNVLPDKSTDLEAHYNAIRDDKGARIEAGLVACQPHGHIMVVDYDDLVSRDLASMVGNDPEAPGWYVEKGFLVDDGAIASVRNGFDRVCGTCLIVRDDLFRPDPGESRRDYVRYVLGSHLFIKERLAKRGLPLKAIPWRAACYRVGHASSTDRSSAVVAELSLRRLIRSPRMFLKKAAKLRLVTGRLRREFYGSDYVEVKFP
jgi:hypothetical protein